VQQAQAVKAMLVAQVLLEVQALLVAVEVEQLLLG
jgi:hypothetical protein